MALDLADDVTLSPYPVEDIPDDAFLYMRVHISCLKQGSYPTGAFSPKGKERGVPGEGRGMSTDWSRYSTPHQTRARATSPLEDNCVISFPVKDLKKLKASGITFRHTPIRNREIDNRAHTDIYGFDQDEIEGTRSQRRIVLAGRRNELAEIYQLVVPWPNDPT